MAVFETLQFTKKGRSLLSRIYLGSTLTFTKMSLSSNLHSGIEEMTDIKQNFVIGSFIYEDLDHLAIKAQGNNKDLQEGYFVRSLGIYADDPVFGEILFCYANADPADYIPAYNERMGVTESEYCISFAIKDAEKVTVQVQEQAYTPKSDFDEAMLQRPARYLMDQLPALSAYDYYLDLICSDRDSILQQIEILKAVENVQLLEADSGIFKVVVDGKEKHVGNVKEHASDITDPTEVAIII